MKKSVSLLLALVLAVGILFSVMGTASAETWYNGSANGGRLKVRLFPSTVDSPVIGYIEWGGPVSLRMTMASGWAVIDWNGDVGYVMSRFLSETKPTGPNPKKTAEAQAQKEKETEAKKLSNELKSERDVSEIFYVAVVATRTSGQINFRSGPSKTTKRVASLKDGTELLVIGETDNWYHARIDATGAEGYIFKQYTRKLNKPVSYTQTASNEGSLGTLNVNGAFDLTCKIPDGYKMQVINVRNTSIQALFLADEMTRPDLNLIISYDDTYGDVERMNDLSDDQLKVLEETFTDLDDVEISYAETGHGTKLLIAKENDSDGATEYVAILAIYKGYFIEFTMQPNENVADAALTDEQIRMCIDFLTDVDFIEKK